MTTPPVRIHAMQASGNAFHPAEQAGEALAVILRRVPTVVGLTEVTRDHAPTLARVARAHGFHLLHGAGDVALALHRRHRIRRSEAIPLHPGGRDEAGAYGPRALAVVEADVDGELVTFVEGHWVRPRTPARRRRHRLTTAAALRILDARSIGRRIAVLMGDTNEVDTPDPARPGTAGALLEGAGVTTVYDEVGLYPGTGPKGYPIDVIATVDADRRLSVTGIRTWTAPGLDHKQLSAYLRIRP